MWRSQSCLHHPTRKTKLDMLGIQLGDSVWLQWLLLLFSNLLRRMQLYDRIYWPNSRYQPVANASPAIKQCQRFSFLVNPECWLVYEGHWVQHNSKLKMKDHPLSKKLRSKWKHMWESILLLHFTRYILALVHPKLSPSIHKTCKTQNANRHDSDTKGKAREGGGGNIAKRLTLKIGLWSRLDMGQQKGN